MKLVLLRAISWFSDILIFMLLIRTFLSFPALGGNKTVVKVYEMLVALTEPFVLPCRAILQKFNLNSGMIDWSILLSFILIRFVAQVLMQIVMAVF